MFKILSSMYLICLSLFQLRSILHVWLDQMILFIAIIFKELMLLSMGFNKAMNISGMKSLVTV